MNRILPIFGLLLAVGCGYSEEKYADDLTEVLCNKYDECDWNELLGYESVDDCLAAADESSDGETDDSCDFDGTAAKACVDGMDALTCDELSDFTAWPSECSDVCGTAE